MSEKQGPWEYEGDMVIYGELLKNGEALDIAAHWDDFVTYVNDLEAQVERLRAVAGKAIIILDQPIPKDTAELILRCQEECILLGELKAAIGKDGGE